MNNTILKPERMHFYTENGVHWFLLFPLPECRKKAYDRLLDRYKAEPTPMKLAMVVGTFIVGDDEPDEWNHFTGVGKMLLWNDYEPTYLYDVVIMFQRMLKRAEGKSTGHVGLNLMKESYLRLQDSNNQN